MWESVKSTLRRDVCTPGPLLPILNQIDALISEWQIYPYAHSSFPSSLDVMKNLKLDLYNDRSCIHTV